MKTENIRLLSESDTSTVTNALMVAAERFDGHVKDFTELAAQLRAGFTLPLWAQGEIGAIAAERMATQFQRQAADTRRIIERIVELGATIALVPYDED